MKNEYDYFNDAKIDLSVYTEEKLSKEEILKMTKTNKTYKTNKRKFKIIAAAAAAVAVITTVAVGASEGYFDKVIKTITTGHNYFIQMDAEGLHELPKELKGKLFDSEGKALESIKETDLGSLYDASGNKLGNDELEALFAATLGDKISLTSDDSTKSSEVSYYNLEDAAAAADFNLKVPKYIPEGLSFERAYTYKGDNSGYYMNLEYSDSENNLIRIHERLINDETAFMMDTDGELEETEISGIKAVLEKDKNLYFETDDNVSISINTKGIISKDELIKMAESMVK